MSASVRELLDQALKLPPSSRAELARELIASIEPGLDDGEGEPQTVVDAAWQDEVARRVRDVEEERVKLVPSKTVHDDVRGALERPRAKRRK